jgi:hypothetical protein
MSEVGRLALTPRARGRTSIPNFPALKLANLAWTPEFPGSNYHDIVTVAPATRLAYYLSKRAVAQPDATKRPDLGCTGGPFCVRP